MATLHRGGGEGGGDFLYLMLFIDVFIGPPCTVESVDVVSFVAHPFFHNSDYQRPFLVATAAGYNREHDDETELYR